MKGGYNNKIFKIIRARRAYLFLLHRNWKWIEYERLIQSDFIYRLVYEFEWVVVTD